MPVTTIGEPRGPRRRRGVPHRLRRVGRGRWREQLAAAIGIELTDAHWTAIRFLREDYQTQGETATLRRCRPSAASRSRTVRAVPEEAGQEDGLRRRTTQAARLRVKQEYYR